MAAPVAGSNRTGTVTFGGLRTQTSFPYTEEIRILSSDRDSLEGDVSTL